MTATELFEQGGITMFPLLALSLLAAGAICDRLWFWLGVFLQKRDAARAAKEVLQAAARFDWNLAAQLSLNSRKQPAGRLLYAALRYPELEPEAFCIALETAADEELTQMRRGEKILEAAIALAPLLGLLGTVMGLMQSLNGLDLAQLGKSSGAEVTLGISRSLISTATGLAIAITSLAFYRLFQSFIWKQAKTLNRVGNRLELIYRQYWWQIAAATATPVDEEVADASNAVDCTSDRSVFSPLSYEDLFEE